MVDDMSEIRPEQQYEEFLAEGRFMLLRSHATGRCFWFPRVAEPGTGCTDLEWVEASGKGVVYSTTVIRQKPPTPNYNLALIDLAEGARMMSRVEGVPPEEVRIGMQVRAKIVREGERPLLVFEPA
jgi:uncharacterized OB-fold protein